MLGCNRVLVLLALSLSTSCAFYLPGVAPRDYNPGEDMRVKVEALTSVKTQLPYEYYVLPFCHEGVNLKEQDALNLGEVLRGSRIYETPYDFKMKDDQTCKVLCRSMYDKEEIQAFALMAEEEYRVNLLLDNLPVAMPLFHQTEEGESMKAYELGYPLGFADDGTNGEEGAVPQPKKIHLFNHLRFTVLVNEDKSKRSGIRVVGFEVEPFSVKHTHVNKVDWDKCVGKIAGEDGQCTLSTCSASKPISQSSPEGTMIIDADSKDKTEVIWTYDV
jgi:transmembrane 9 superfamily protein 2/4